MNALIAKIKRYIVRLLYMEDTKEILAPPQLNLKVQEALKEGGSYTHLSNTEIYIVVKKRVPLVNGDLFIRANIYNMLYGFFYETVHFKIKEEDLYKWIPVQDQ